MHILGLNFGHDAAAAVLVDGRVASYILRERRSRTKHAVGLDMATIDLALREAGLSAPQIDFVAFTSSQAVESVIDDPNALQVADRLHPAHRCPGLLHAQVTGRGARISQLQQASLAQWLYDTPDESWVGSIWREMFPEYLRYDKSSLPVVYPYLHSYVNHRQWLEARTLDQIGQCGYYRALLGDAPFAVRHAFHFPLTATLRGAEIPAFIVDHHCCHAASVYYQSGVNNAAILTHDGAGDPRGFTTGGFYYGDGHRIWPLAPHFLVVGDLYHNVGRLLGLGRMGAPGKLMGLAAYGQPVFFEDAWAGNYHDLAAGAGRSDPVNAWMSHCLARAKSMGYNLAPLGNPERVLEPVNVDIAASTQLLFEETMLRAADALWKIVHDCGRGTERVCLSGGAALNCPANSRLYNEGRFRAVHVEPSCDDSGLAIGAALFAYHNILDQPEDAGRPGFSPYLGPVSRPAAPLVAELSSRHPHLHVDLPEDPAREAAGILAANGVIGWFEGRSEIGPRALGHRSILADARAEDNWARVNRIKGREAWRPLAPMVLEEEIHNWFSGTPARSPYMLFNAQVRSSRIPAVTHVDGTARVQTVDGSEGGIHAVLQNYARLTGVPVLLNTSFNGPAEPIVETADDAVRFFSGSSLDALFVEGVRLRRK